MALKKDNPLPSRERVPEGRVRGLYAIVDSQDVERFLRGGCRLMQLRMKDAPRDDVQAVARDIMSFKKQYDFTFIVNDHPDVAVAVGADGVHVGKDDTSVTTLRRELPKDFLIGYSSHDLEEAVAAEKAGATYVAFGTIFPTKTKMVGHPVQGIEKLRDVCTRVRVPVVAIGGINRSNVQDVMKAGAHAVAMISALSQAPDIEAEVRWFVNKGIYP